MLAAVMACQLAAGPGLLGTSGNFEPCKTQEFTSTVRQQLQVNRVFFSIAQRTLQIRRWCRCQSAVSPHA